MLNSFSDAMFIIEGTYLDSMIYSGGRLQGIFSGNCLMIPGGTDMPQLLTHGWNDRALSVRTE